jgi:FMN-dependent NADH-azoreductase
MHKKSTELSDEVIKEIFDADIIVINVPMWNFSIPSSLKAYIDQIARAGITFKFGENGPIGLIPDKKVYVAIASGGLYSVEPYKSKDFVVPYLTTVLDFLGLRDITVLRVEGLSLPGIQETAFEKALQSIENLELVA